MNISKLGRLRELAVCHKLANEYDVVPDSDECLDGDIIEFGGSWPLDFQFNRIKVLDKYMGMSSDQITNLIIKEIMA